MARRPPPPRSRPRAEPPPPRPEVKAKVETIPEARPRLALAVAALLALHWALAVRSLLRENPTIDEVVHLPAGVTYWQTGTFKLYPHNPPLVKLFAAWPVVRARPEMARLYEGPYWPSPPNKAGFAHQFAEENARRYFELFDRARSLMPTFAVLGGLVVFAWSRRLYGPWGGLLSLSLWAFCPNVLAHGRLVTTDVGATVLGFAATYLFWRYLHQPTWWRAAVAGVALGLAELAKFSMLLLYGLWPLLWLLHELGRRDRQGLARRVGRSLAQGLAIVALSVLYIDAGYGFEKVGQPLGRFPFVSRTLTRDRERPLLASPRPKQGDILGRLREYRVNRFAGTWLGALPSPLPRYYLTGFDEQKMEAEGVPSHFMAEPPELGDALSTTPEGRSVHGYPTYLNGDLRDESPWYYYLLALVYKVPEGTWALVLGSFAVLVASRRCSAPWPDELAVLAVPVVMFGVMSFGTNIGIGLRYVLPIFPYVYVSAGKLAPWASGLRGVLRWAAVAGISACLVATAAATIAVHPHYLAYFNWVSGGPARGSEHLVDSNLDWGQDLVNLREWARENAPGEPVGLAYFGQIDPMIFHRRGDEFAWFLPPALPKTMELRPASHARGGRLLPPRSGLYAVSATLVRGVPWRVYSPPEDGLWREGPDGLRAFATREPRGYWSAGPDAYRYFEGLRPIGQVGHSIFLYRITPEDADRLARRWGG